MEIIGILGFAKPMIIDDLWKQIRTKLMENQWRWMKFHIRMDITVKDISDKDKVSIEVKGRQVSEKLRHVEGIFFAVNEKKGF